MPWLLLTVIALNVSRSLHNDFLHRLQVAAGTSAHKIRNRA